MKKKSNIDDIIDSNEYKIHVKGLEVNWKNNKQAVAKNVSFTIFENEIMGLMGPSGAGKSSVFKVLSMVKQR